MATYAVQVILQGDTGLPSDQYVNTWHFYHSSIAPISDHDNVRDMLKDFYTLAVPSSVSVSKYLTSKLTTTAKVKSYNLDEDKPRVPAYESTFPLTGLGTGMPVPYESALCLSFEGAKASGEIQARKRNRVYLGPLASGILWSDGRPIATALTVITEAAKRLWNAADASATWDWKVYSPTNDEIYAVKHLWCDDAFDSQRRRGLAASTRVQWTSSG